MTLKSEDNIVVLWLLQSTTAQHLKMRTILEANFSGDFPYDFDENKHSTMSINSQVNISMSCHIFNASRSDAVTVCAFFLFPICHLSLFVIISLVVLTSFLFLFIFFFKILRGMCENAAMSPKPSVTKRISGAISFAGDVSNSINNKRSQTININYTPNTASK